MGSASSILTIPELLKEIWDDHIEEYMFKDQPFYGLVSKDTSWDGEILNVTCELSVGGGGSALFESAKANKQAPKLRKMQVETSDNFQLWSIDYKLVALSRTNQGSLARALEFSTRNALNHHKRRTCRAFWGNGGGSLGKISAINSNKVTLVDRYNVRNFNAGIVVNLSVDDGSLGVSNAGIKSGSLMVTDVNQMTGVVTFNNNVTTVSGATVGDFLFTEGDYGAALYGVPAYVTLSDPGTNSVPTTIWGADRATFMREMSGARFTGSNLQIIEAIQTALMEADVLGMETSHIFCHPTIYNLISLSLEGAKVFEPESKGVVGYEALIFTTQGGKKVKVYSDADITKSADGTKSYVYGLDMAAWKFSSAGPYPSWQNEKGNKSFMIEENANACEGRVAGFAQLYTPAPGRHWVLALT